jgi:hypothetical protein
MVAMLLDEIEFCIKREPDRLSGRVGHAADFAVDEADRIGVDGHEPVVNQPLERVSELGGARMSNSRHYLEGEWIRAHRKHRHTIALAWNESWQLATHTANGRRLAQRLRCQGPVETLVTLVGTDVVPRGALQLEGDVLDVSAPEYDRNDAIVLACLVQHLSKQLALPHGAFPSPSRLVSGEPPSIRFGADHDTEISLLHLPTHPAGPSLRRRNLVRVDDAVDTVGPQPVGQYSHTFGVLCGIVRIANDC